MCAQEGIITWKDCDNCEITVTVGGWAELCNGGPTSSIRREKGAAMGPMTALRVWGLSFLSQHVTFGVPSVNRALLPMVPGEGGS